MKSSDWDQKPIKVRCWVSSLWVCCLACRVIQAASWIMMWLEEKKLCFSYQILLSVLCPLCDSVIDNYLFVYSFKLLQTNKSSAGKWLTSCIPSGDLRSVFSNSAGILKGYVYVCETWCSFEFGAGGTPSEQYKDSQSGGEVERVRASLCQAKCLEYTLWCWGLSIHGPVIEGQHWNYKKPQWGTQAVVGGPPTLSGFLEHCQAFNSH